MAQRFALPSLPFTRDISSPNGLPRGSSVTLRATPIDDDQKKVILILNTSTGDAAAECTIKCPNSSRPPNQIQPARVLLRSCVAGVFSSPVEGRSNDILPSREFTLLVDIKEHALEVSINSTFVLSFVHRINPIEIRQINLNGPIICSEVVIQPANEKGLAAVLPPPYTQELEERLAKLSVNGVTGSSSAPVSFSHNPGVPLSSSPIPVMQQPQPPTATAPPFSPPSEQPSAYPTGSYPNPQYSTQSPPYPPQSTPDPQQPRPGQQSYQAYPQPGHPPQAYPQSGQIGSYPQPVQPGMPYSQTRPSGQAYPQSGMSGQAYPRPGQPGYPQPTIPGQAYQQPTYQRYPPQSGVPVGYPSSSPSIGYPSGPPTSAPMYNPYQQHGYPTSASYNPYALGQQSNFANPYYPGRGPQAMYRRRSSSCCSDEC